MSVTTIHLTEGLSEALDRIADETQRSHQAVKEYVMRTHNGSERWQETLTALDSMKAGRIVESKVVDSWLADWGKQTKTRG